MEVCCTRGQCCLPVLVWYPLRCSQNVCPMSVSPQIKSAKTIKERCEAVKKQSAAMADRLHAMHAANAPVVRVVSET